VAAPLAVGVGFGAPQAGVIAALGALWTVTQELPGPTRDRLARMSAVALAGPVGFVLGEGIAHGAAGPWSTAAAIALIAAVNGLLTPAGPIHSAAGLYLLLGTVLGRWLDAAGPWWRAPVLMLAGAVPVVVMTGIAWIATRRSTPARTVAQASAAVAGVLAAAGQDSFRPLRSKAVRDLDLAADSAARRGGTLTPEAVSALATVVEVAEISAVIHAERLPVPDDLITAVRRIGAPAATAASPAAHGASASTASTSLARLRELIGAGPEPAQPTEFEQSTQPTKSPMPGPTPLTHRLRFTLALMVAVFAAALAAGMLGSSHSYWLPLSVAFIFKPDLGPVFHRAVARTAGTVGGVIAAAAIGGVFGRSPLALVLFAALFAAMLPTAARTHHAWAVFAFTPIVFVFLSLLGDGPRLLPVRAADTAAAALVVLLAERFLAPSSWTRRAESLTDAAESAALAYRHGGALLDGAARHGLRRAAFSSIERARSAAGKASGDPGGRRHRQLLEARLRAAEDVCDEVTLRVFHFPN
jgi:hypothetical protein